MPEVTSALIRAIESAWYYLWFVFLGIWGGTVNYIGKLKGSQQPFSFVELVGEWTISGFSGLITAYVCESMGLDFAITAVAAGISGHMGGRAIYIAEKWMQDKFYWRSKFGSGTGIADEEERKKYDVKRDQDE